MKLTLLEIVQDMLTAIDGEGASSVGEHAEAGMCTNIANRAFEKMITQLRWRHLRRYAQLSTTSNLNEMVTPTGTYAIDPFNVYYDDDPVYYLSPEQFLAMTIRRTESDSNIDVINNIKVYNDRNPLYFTSDDDTTLRFDAIPDAEDGLSGSDTMCLCYVAPTSRLTSDGQYFDLPLQAFPTLDTLCISMALTELKGDTQAGSAKMREYIKQMGALAVNARLVDRPTDLRKHIVPRRGRAVTIPRIV